MYELTTWIREHAANAAGSGAALQLALMRDDPTRFEQFRHRVLHRSLVGPLQQPAREVYALLKQELLGEPLGGSVHPVSWEPNEDAGFLDEHVVVEASAHFGPADIVQLAIDVFESDTFWDALAQNAPDHPVNWAASNLAWRVRDRLRPRGVRDVEPVQPHERAHHGVAARLDLLQLADPEWGGPAVVLHGIYRDTLGAIREHLATVEGSTGASYALRKLFPPHAWSFVPFPDDSLPAWLLEHLTDLWRDPDAWAAFVNRPPRPWEVWGRTPVTVRDGLDAAARTHMAHASFPSWSEVGGWIREPDVSTNTLQRRVGRLDSAILEIVDAAIARVHAAAAEEGSA